MTTTINASTSAGLVNTADTSGVLQLQTASTAAVTIDTSQNVGIGTTSPSSVLHVKGTSGLTVQRSDSGDQSINFLDSSAVTKTILYSLNTGTNGGAFRFDTKTDGGSTAERMRIDSSGNLLVGTTASGSATKSILLSSTGYLDWGNGDCRIADSSGAMLFYTYTTGNFGERMRIDGSGNLLIGSTSVSASPATKGFQVTSGGSNISVFDNTDGLGFSSTSNTKSIGMSAGIAYGSGAGNSWIKLNPTTGSSASIVMQANSNGVILNNNATAWASNSDLRLKNVTGNYENALVDIAQIEPVKFTWKADKENQPQVGVIAQSVENIVPEAISKTKSIEGDDTEYLQVRYTELIPLMIASIQELNAKVDAQATTITDLTTRLAALEGAK